MVAAQERSISKTTEITAGVIDFAVLPQFHIPVGKIDGHHKVPGLDALSMFPTASPWRSWTTRCPTRGDTHHGAVRGGGVEFQVIGPRPGDIGKAGGDLDIIQEDQKMKLPAKRTSLLKKASGTAVLSFLAAVLAWFVVINTGPERWAGNQ